MTQPGAMLYTQGFGSRPESVEVPHIDVRAPAVTDIKYPIGKKWVDKVANKTYTLTSFSSALGVVSANWAPEGSSAEIFNVLGTANQITSTVASGVATLSIPSAFQAPGSVTAATGLTATTGGVTASAGNIVATLGNITASAGNIAATLGSVSAGTSLSAGTTVTATLGAITATNGNLVLGTAGNKLSIATGANASVGTAELVAGTVTVSTTAVTTNSKIFVTVGTLGTVVAPQAMYVDAIVNGTSFDITSADGTDTSFVNWLIIN